MKRDANDRTASGRLDVKVTFVSYPVAQNGREWRTSGVLRVPTIGETPSHATSEIPAVLIVHGSNGVDSRGGWYAGWLNKAGIATLEIDLWSVRGVTQPSERPKTVHETLPDAFGALAFLAANGRINSAKIGIMGFSWGGVLSMLTATVEANRNFNQTDHLFAAHLPLYPICWVYNRVPEYGFANLTGKPILILSGAADLYDAPTSCEALHASLPDLARRHVSQITYPGATHAWDRREPDVVVHDPFSYLGAGGEVPFQYDAETTWRSTMDVVSFFQSCLGVTRGDS